MADKSNVGLKTRHVFLDTQVYRQYGHNLNAKVLQSFLKQIEDHVCTLHITDITLFEIKRQIGELAAEVAQAVNKGNKELRSWQARSTHSGQPKKIEDLDPRELAPPAETEFNLTISTTWKAVRHDALEIDPKEVFKAYFRREAPFDKADSKEFPDAFVVAALDRWCQQHNQQMYVVTRDGAMKRAAERTKTLIPLSSLDELLQIIVEAQDPTILKRVEGLLESSKWASVEERIREQIAPLGTVYVGGLYDGEITDHYPGKGSVELEDFHVVSVSKEQIEVVAKVKVPVGFEVQYLDTSHAMYDKEDDTYIGADTESATFDQEVTINVFIVIDAEDEELTEVEILTRDLYLEEVGEDYY